MSHPESFEVYGALEESIETVKLRQENLILKEINERLKHTAQPLSDSESDSSSDKDIEDLELHNFSL